MEFAAYQRKYKTTRPLSALQIRADVRAKYSRMCFKKLSEMLMPYCMYVCDCYAVCISYCISVDDNGRIIARVVNPAVSSALLQDVDQWNKEGATIDDVIERLRLRTAPSEYVGTIHTWIEGMTVFKLTMFTVSCTQARMKLE